jgi:hypothetical protein
MALKINNPKNIMINAESRFIPPAEAVWIKPYIPNALNHQIECVFLENAAEYVDEQLAQTVKGSLTFSVSIPLSTPDLFAVFHAKVTEKLLELDPTLEIAVLPFLGQTRPTPEPEVEPTPQP